MSATKITASQTKLARWQEIRELDKRAAKIAEDEGIALIDAYARAVEEKR